MSAKKSVKNSPQGINPLWMISTFFSLTETVLGYVVFKTSGGIQIALTVFVLVFPTVIALAFFIILWYRPKHLYAPKDYANDDSFLISMSDSHKTQRVITADLYLDTEDRNKINDTFLAVQNLVDVMGLKKISEDPEQKGSWIKKLYLKTKTAMTSNELVERLEIAKYSVNAINLMRDQSEINNETLKAVSKIISSIENIENAVIRIGSLLVVKVKNGEGESQIITRLLSLQEMLFLQKNPSLVNKPNEIIGELKALLEKSQLIDKELEDSESIDYQEKGNPTNMSENNSRRISATIEPSATSGFYKVTINVASIDFNKPLSGTVRFHFDNSLGHRDQIIEVQNGIATLTLAMVFSGFKVSAETDNGHTFLELDTTELFGARTEIKE